MIKKWLARVFWIPVLVLTVLFLVANRAPVALSLDPINASEPAVTTPALPLWAWLILMVFFGVASGALGMWMSGRPNRIARREQRETIKALRQDVSRLETQLREERARAGDPDAPPPLLASESV